MKYGEAAEAKEGESFGRGEVVEVEADETSMAAVEVLMSSDQNDSFCQGGDSIPRSSSHNTVQVRRCRLMQIGVG